MADFDMRSDVNYARGANMAVTTAAVNGELIDMRGFEALTVVAFMAAISNAGAGVTFKLQHSDTTANGDFVDCAASEVIGSIPAIDNVNQANTLRGTIGYRGNRRYVRLVATGSAAADANVVPLYVRGRPHSAPVAPIGAAAAAV
jgi:hypothetical protein